MDEPGSLILKVALESYDRLLQARTEVERDGQIINDHLGKRQHPALRLEKEARSGLLQAWRLLNFDIEPPGPIGRLPGPRGVG